MPLFHRWLVPPGRRTFWLELNPPAQSCDTINLMNLIRLASPASRLLARNEMPMPEMRQPFLSPSRICAGRSVLRSSSSTTMPFHDLPHDPPLSFESSVGPCETRSSLRLHRSEPSLLLAPHASSRFSRLHSTDPFGFFHPHLTPPPSPPPPPPPPPPPLPQAAPPKRKISLGNLLAKPLMLRAKRSLSREIPEECAVPADPIGSAAPAAATAAGPAVVGRVRSRSAPFSTFVSPSITLTDFGSGQSACIFSVGSSEDSSEDSESPAPRLRRPFVPPPSLVDCTATNAELSNAPPAPALDAPVVVVVSRLSPSPVRSPRCLVASCQQPQPHHEAPADVSWTESSLAEDTAAPDSSSSTCVAASGAAAPTEALATSPRPSALGQSEGGDTPKGASPLPVYYFHVTIFTKESEARTNSNIKSRQSNKNEIDQT